MIKQLRKVGNSNALILDKAILELLGLRENGLVQLSLQDGALTIVPVNPTKVDVELMAEKLEYVLQKRKKALRRLAE